MKYLKLIITGFVLFAAVFIAELLVTLPLPMAASEDAEVIRQYLVWEFLLTAIPAGVLSYLAAKVLKLKEKPDLILASVIWTVIYLALMLVIAIGNQRTGLIFGNYAFYILVACFFAGPLVQLVRKSK